MKDNIEEFGRLLRFLQYNDFRIVMVEGPRGVGKSTFIETLLSRTNFAYYKTWGRAQKTDRFEIGERGLELPQGTYFILDFLSQVEAKFPVLADRGNLTSLVYQRDKYLYAHPLHTYYIDLMDKCRAVLIYLDAPSTLIAERRVNRKDEDEQRLDLKGMDVAIRAVKEDQDSYDEALDVLCRHGLREVFGADLSGSIEAYCYTSNKLKLLLDEEEDTDDDSE